MKNYSTHSARTDDPYKVSTGFAVMKRVFDIIGSAICIILCAPLFVIIYIAIKREDSGPAIFCQERVGFKGKIFTIYKFRSMVDDAEKEGEAILCKEDDDRLTATGRFLRDHHIDELPQLWNVLKGDMAFVGPRPERKYFVDKIIAENPDYRYLYRLRPGLFSEATLYNGYTDTMEKMLRRLSMDLDYLKEQSILKDIKIISETLYSILSGKKF